jgi:hypothetical protein
MYHSNINNSSSSCSQQANENSVRIFHLINFIREKACLGFKKLLVKKNLTQIVLFGANIDEKKVFADVICSLKLFSGMMIFLLG